MDDIGGGPALRPNLVDRVKNIILKPNEEWPRIAAEPDSIADIYRRHVLPLAAIGPVCMVLGSLLFASSMYGVYAPAIGWLIGNAIVQYVLTLVGVYLLALVIDALAPTFSATSGRVAAFKVAAYSATASWLCGIFWLLPPLLFLTLLGLYSIYLLYLGLQHVMNAPKDKAVAYVAVVFVAVIIALVMIRALAAPLSGLFAPSYPPSAVGI